MQYLIAMLVCVLLVGCGSVDEPAVANNPKEFLPTGVADLDEVYNGQGQSCDMGEGTEDYLISDDEQCRIGVCVKRIGDFCTVRCGDGIGDCLGNPDECVDFGNGKSFCVPIEWVPASGD